MGIKVVRNAVGSNGTRTEGSRAGRRVSGRRTPVSRQRKQNSQGGVPAMVWIGIAVFVFVVLIAVAVALNSGSSSVRKRQASASSLRKSRASGPRNNGEMGRWMKEHGTDKIAEQRKKENIQAYKERERQRRAREQN